jgi:hypothetical protein
LWTRVGRIPQEQFPQDQQAGGEADNDGIKE